MHTFSILLEALHSPVVHLPWCAAIPLGTLLLRSAVLPLQVYARTRSRRLEAIQPLVTAIHNSRAGSSSHEGILERLTRTMRDLKTSSFKQVTNVRSTSEDYSTRMALKELYSRHGCTPALTFALSLAQFPVFIAASLDLRYLITTNHSSEFASQGLLFIPDLTACDPTLISPLILGLLHYHNSKKIRYRAVMWMFTIGSSYVASLVPAGVLLYWVTSATFSAVIHQLRLLD